MSLFEICLWCICDEDGNSKFSSWVEFVASISGANWQIYVLGRPIGNTKPLPRSPTVLIVIMFLVIAFQREIEYYVLETFTASSSIPKDCQQSPLC